MEIVKTTPNLTKKKTSNAMSGPCRVTHTGLPFAGNRDLKVSIKTTDRLGRDGEIHITSSSEKTVPRSSSNLSQNKAF